MFVIKRNQVIVTALVVMVAVAGYLNFTDSKVSESGTLESALVLTNEGDIQNALVPAEGDITTLADDYDENLDISMFDPITAEAVNTLAEEEYDDTGAAVFVSATASADTYFIQAKLDREQARAQQQEILTEMINNNNISEGQKSDCAASMLDIQKRIEKESAAEALIEAKGFGEAYVRIDDETVDVVVSKSELTEAEVAQIMDIVKRKTGVDASQIRITTLK